MKPTPSRDGKDRLTVRVEHRVNASMAAHAVVLHFSPEEIRAGLSERKIGEALHAELAFRGRDFMDVELDDEEEGVREEALAFVRKRWPTLAEY